MEIQSPTLVDANGFAIATRSLLLSVTANNDSVLDFTGLGSTFPRYVIEGDNVASATDAVQLNALFSIAGDFKSGIADYSWVARTFSSDTSNGQSQDASDSRISTCRTANGMWGSSGSETGDITFTITRGGLANHPRLRSVTVNFGDGADLLYTHGHGAYIGGTSGAAGAGGIDGVRLLFSSGLIQQGNFRLYGVN